MKKILLLTFSIFAFISFAKQVDVNTAKQIAERQANLYMPQLTKENSTSLIHTFKILVSGQEKNAFYAFDVKGHSGFVLVSGDDLSIPILGYSDEGGFGDVNSAEFPKGLRKLIDLYRDEIKRIIIENAPQSEEVKELWGQFTKGDFSVEKSSVSPLLTTKWTQRNSFGYNDLCPGGSPTGCVATAFAQILKFYNHPAQGTGFYSYNHSTYGTLSANFGATTYNWASMPDQLTSSSTAAQKAAIATLMYHCGVSVDMNYSPSGSGASSIDVEAALESFFSYKTTAQYIARSSYSLANWKTKLKTELNNTRVVYHKGFCPDPSAGHAFIVDGYDNTDKFHLNWGWGGSYNGYFEINNLNPGSTYVFNQAQGAIIGIAPINSTYDLKLNSAITINPNPIVRSEAVTVTATIKNNGGALYNGQLAAFLFDAVNGSLVDTIKIVNQAINGNGSNTVTFNKAGLSATPANYTVGIYYKNQTGNWVLLNPTSTSYANPLSTKVISTPQNLRANQNITIVTSDPIEQNQPVNIKFVFKNKINSAFNGNVSIDLHKPNGQWIKEIEIKNISISANGTRTVNFNSAGLNVPPGTYRLVAWYQHPTEDWQIVESTNTYQSSRSVDVVGLDYAFAPVDPYEDNNTQNTAYEFPVSFTNNSFFVNTIGSNIHDTIDVDYYKVVLPTGGAYTVDITAHDQYNSTNGQVYTNDVMYRIWDNHSGTWSDYFDDVSPTMTFTNWTALYVEVIPYFYGNIGNYELDIKVVNSGNLGLEDLSEDNIVLFPNPTKDFVSVTTKDGAKINSIEIRNQLGQIVIQEIGNTSNINVSDLSNGIYTFTIYSDKGQLTQKFIKQ